MPFALIQRRLEIPDVAALRRALAGRDGWHPSDAANLAADAFGILVRGLDEPAGHHLADILAREGIQVEVVEESDLPALPLAKRLRRAGVRPDAFIAHDPYDREIAVPWDRICLVCAGEVRRSEFRPVVRTPSPPPWEEEGRFQSADTGLTINLEQRNWCWVADLVLAGGEVRFSLAADGFYPQGFTGPLSRDPAENLQEFIRTVMNLAPNAVSNRGAFGLGDSGSRPGPRYPTRNAYQEEMIWLLWRMAKTTDSGSTPAPTS